MPGVFDGGLNAQAAADAKDPLAVHRRAVIPRQLVPNTPVALIRAFLMDFLHQPGQTPVFQRAGADPAGAPLVVSSSGNVQRTARFCHGIPLFLRGPKHCFILSLLTELPQ